MSYPYNSLHFLTLRIHFALIHYRTVKRGWSFWQKKLLVAVKWWRHWTLFSRREVDRVSTTDWMARISTGPTWSHEGFAWEDQRRPHQGATVQQPTPKHMVTSFSGWFLRCATTRASNRCSNNNQKYSHLSPHLQTYPDVTCHSSRARMISWWTSALDHRSIWKTILDKDHLRFGAIGAAVVRFSHASRHGKIVSKKRHERGVLHSQSSSLQSKDVQIGWDKEIMCLMVFLSPATKTNMP